MKNRIFSLKSEWIYLKIYCGIKMSDILLQEGIYDLVEELKTKKLIKQWFFIRFSDPQKHLRIRFQLVDILNYDLVMGIITNQLQHYLESREIENIIIDTYIREIERYGINSIEFAEYLFYKSSDLTLKFLNYNDEDRLIFSFYYFENIISKFCFSDDRSQKIIQQSNLSFKKEFHANKTLNGQLKHKFSRFCKLYEDFKTNTNYTEIRNLITNNIIDPKIYEKQNLNEFSDSFIKGIYHMHINRMFISKQRVFEMIIYDYLNRYYSHCRF